MSRLEALKKAIRSNDPTTFLGSGLGSTVDAPKWTAEGKRSVYIETYGCQMNVSDAEVVQAVMEKAGYDRSARAEEADVVLVNTCAIRDKAEQRVWERLSQLKALKMQRERRTREGGPMMVGVLGCMAERLKERLLESDRLVDVVCGPDAYRSLPQLLTQAEGGQPGMNVQLSLEETYADIAPVRTDADGVSGFVSIMRGCNNMCSYCIVPFTRGRERSREVGSIVDEVRDLAARGYREVVLLGQNVNSYNDVATEPRYDSDAAQVLSRGFRAMARVREYGVRFPELVETVAKVDPRVRVRFTSPHPKDFPDDLLRVIREYPNVCRAIHIPAQSGSSRVLESMRRGYSREAYLDLIERIRRLVPGVSLSTDMISGFCGETEDDHLETLDLMRRVRYDHAYMFAYSLREKTHAHRHLSDDVPADVKQRRLTEVIDEFRAGLTLVNRTELGRNHSVLLERTAKRNADEWIGRADNNRRVAFPKSDVSNATPGMYVQTEITEARGGTLRGRGIQLLETSIDFQP